MTKSELVKVIAKKFDESQKNLAEGEKSFCDLRSSAKAEKMIDLVLGTIEEALVEDGKVSISGFGTFEVRERSAKQCINPRTKEMITVPGYKAAVFKSGKNLKEAVNK